MDKLFDYIASDHPDVQTVRRLIAKGAKRHSKGLGGALHHAAWYGRTEIVEFLLSIGEDVDSRDYQGEKTAVFVAIERKYYSLAKLLLRHGADPDATSTFDGTLLSQAVKSGDAELTALILERKKAKGGAYPKGAVCAAAQLGDLAVVKLLVEAGIEPNDRYNYEKETALMKAALAGKNDVLQYLLENGADVSARDYKGHTALLHAAAGGQDAAAKILLSHGADVTEKNDLHWNALMQAVFRGHLSTAEILLHAGSPVAGIDLERGLSTLALAKHSENAELVALLESHGAKERSIRLRKPDEPYFFITDCDICTYLPHQVELTHDYAPEKIPGLEIIHETCEVDYKAEETVMIKRCIHCGTYYNHYHYIDTEDSIGGAGPICNHRLSRSRLSTMPGELRRLGKPGEADELEARYPAIVEAFTRLCKSDYKFMPYLQPFAIETLADFFTLKKDTAAIQIVLMQRKDPQFVEAAAKYINRPA